MHGEAEGQEELKQKIEATSECKVIIPEFGESYELKEEAEILDRNFYSCMESIYKLFIIC